MARRAAALPSRVAITLFVLPGVLCGAALAQRSILRQPDLVRLEGRVGEPRPDDKGTTDLELGRGAKRYRFQLEKLTVLNGRRSPGQVLSDVQPYHPNFNLVGAEAMLQRLDEAKPTDRVTILGYLRLGVRDLMVSEVKAEPAATTSPTAGAKSNGAS